MAEKLDYIQQLGVDCIWLLPMYPSPYKDDGYDISDFMSIHHDYGTVADFKALLDAAHERGLKVIADLVVNHTSDQHAWFQEGRKDPDSPYRDYYVWSDDPTRIPTRASSSSTPKSRTGRTTRKPVCTSGIASSAISPISTTTTRPSRKRCSNIVRYWLDMGLDGFRCDAVPYLIEREGTICENLPETHAFLQRLRRDGRRGVPGQDPARRGQPVARGRGRILRHTGRPEFHMAFHFPLMPRMFMAHSPRGPDPDRRDHDAHAAIPENAQWAIFLRNHDELTLEMVTDEERDYMYSEYAKDSMMRRNVGIRRRLAPLLENSRRKIELMNSLLLSLPGTPVIYYGDEIGMGDNVFLGDRNGVRTPMQWSGDRNAGFSRADAARLYDAADHRPGLWVSGGQRRGPGAVADLAAGVDAPLHRVRKGHPVFGRGDYSVLRPETPMISAHIRADADDMVLCVDNLSRSVQASSSTCARTTAGCRWS